jgi:hypothetical protein
MAGAFHCRFRLTAAMFLCLLVGIAAPLASGQSTAVGGLPRTPDGKPNLAGFWQALNTAGWNLEDHPALKGVPPGESVVQGGDIPYQPWATAKRKENFENQAAADPENKCFLPGVPRATYQGFPFQIVQTPKQMTFLYEYAHGVRAVYTDGTKHPDGHIDWWLGDSRGHWEDDTFVADVVDFDERTWFDRSGNFHSDELHGVERYTLTDPDHIDYEATIEDPKVFTRPWKISMPLYRRKEKNFQLLEYECHTFDLERYYP